MGDGSKCDEHVGLRTFGNSAELDTPSSAATYDIKLEHVKERAPVLRGIVPPDIVPRYGFIAYFPAGKSKVEVTTSVVVDGPLTFEPGKPDFLLSCE